jgi:hypothetical protein
LLSAGIKFNIVMFGSSHSFMHPSCVDYDAASEAAAVAWIGVNVNAEWGGTEILGCLQAIYQHPITSGKPPPWPWPAFPRPPPAARSQAPRSTPPPQSLQHLALRQPPCQPGS